MAGENEGAQTITEAPGTSQQPVVTPGEAQNSGETLLGGKPEGTPDGTTTGEGKTEGEGESGKEGGNEGDGKTDAETPPIEYTDFTVPEGMQLDEQMLGQFTPIAKELGLDQEQAQKFVDMYAKKVAADSQAWADQVATWADQSRSDTEFGGAKFDENLGTAVKAVKAFGSPQLLDLLNSTGMGNHPEMLRFCLRVGSALAEDKVLAPGAASGSRLSAADVLFDHPTSKHQR